MKKHPAVHIKTAMTTKIILVACLLLQTTLAFENDEEFEKFLKNIYEPNATQTCLDGVRATYANAIDVNNKEKQKALLDVTLKNAKISKYIWKTYLHDLDPSKFHDESLQRQAKYLKLLGTDALDHEKLNLLTTINTNMTTIYSSARICPFTKQNCDLAKEGLTLDPDLTQIMENSTDYEELLYVWKEWRQATGSKIKSMYNTYVELSNEAAKLNGFADNSEMWKFSFESPNFEDDLEELWLQVKPLYAQLHKYVGKKLKERYGDILDISDGLIPAHVFGNMWAQSWTNLAELVRPYPTAASADVTKELKDAKYTVEKIFETSNEFYLSLGLENCSMSYDTKQGAVITKPKDRDIVCHASAWDFCSKEFKIKMCTKVNGEDFIVVHHEMGHIQYFLLYKNLPTTFRTGANPGFHEAVGDTIALSVDTPKHLKKIGLLKDHKESSKSEINHLMDMALNKIAFLPFGYLIDKWRWDVFSGKVAPEKYNSHYWKYRKEIQLVKEPVKRSNKKDFDPGAKYHVAGDSQYISYFVAHILQFQFYKSLCKEAGEFVEGDRHKPLHKCDFYNSKEAGDKLRAGLSLGLSKHWSHALKAITGETELSASAIMEYFSPLYKFLIKENAMPEDAVATILDGEYNERMGDAQKKSFLTSWDTETDLGNATKEEAQLNATLHVANVEKHYWTKYFQYLEPKLYKNKTIQRELEKLNKVGDAALGDEKLKELSNCTMFMTTLYGQAKVCPFKKQNCNLKKEGLSLEPEIEDAFSNSTNEKELAYLWTAWRNATGAKMKETYKTYVHLSNLAAKSNYYEDRGEMWRDDFESPTFIEDMNKLWKQVQPLYASLHKYAIKKLKTRYPNLDFSDGLIPAHILGNMWAQTWTALSPIMKPYPDAAALDVTKALVNQGYTPLKMFETADEFYKSLGLEPCTMSYNTTLGAIIEKPKGKDIVCHASAWDFYDGKDFRIKMCTKVTGDDFVTIHHEMGHIQYYILYKNQPVIFKDGANPGFHEAVGDTIALSVSSVKHLRRIKLIKDYVHSEQADINALMDMALEKVAFLPFGLLIDKWRWDVFNETKGITPDKWNEHWWHYRKTIQKVKPPVHRSSNDFDPGAKFHVANGDYYISYFIANILQFQLYRGLCKVAGEYEPGNKAKPLYNCDYYKSVEAGNKLRAGLSLGSSKHWKDVLEAITGERDYDATAILEYFQPLKDVLDGMKDPKPGAQVLPIAIGLLCGVVGVAVVLFCVIKGFRRQASKRLGQ